MTAKIVTSPVSRRYLTGFPSSAGTLIILADGTGGVEKRYFLIDSRYYDKAKTIVNATVIKQDNYFDQINNILTENNSSGIQLETQHLTHAQFCDFKQKFPAFNISGENTLDTEISAKRAVKTPEEIAKIKAAASIADQAFNLLIPQLKPGMTERQIATLLHILILKCGADDIAFDLIVASGENSAIPHATPTGRILKDGDVLLIDFGARKDGYHSDCTRTLFVGGKASEKARAAYTAVERAQKLAISLMKPGGASRSIDKAVKQSIIDAGFQPYGHGLSHGVGLEIHEAPTVSENSGGILEKGNVITCEPGIYIPSEFGIRIEDLVFIK